MFVAGHLIPELRWWWGGGGVGEQRRSLGQGVMELGSGCTQQHLMTSSTTKWG